MSVRYNARLWAVSGAIVWVASSWHIAQADNQAKCSACPEMTTVPAGSFQMGKSVNRGYGEIDGPTHTVTIQQPFKVARHEVTLGEFRAFTRATGYVSQRKCNIYRHPDRLHGGEGTRRMEDRPHAINPARRARMMRAHGAANSVTKAATA